MAWRILAISAGSPGDDCSEDGVGDGGGEMALPPRSGARVSPNPAAAPDSPAQLSRAGSAADLLGLSLPGFGSIPASTCTMRRGALCVLSRVALAPQGLHII